MPKKRKRTTKPRLQNNGRMDKIAPDVLPAKGEVVPPGLHEQSPMPHAMALDTLADVRTEMQSVYLLARRGKIRIEDATRLVYLLDRITSAIKTERELDQLESEYARAFTGLMVRVVEKPNNGRPQDV